MYTRLHLAFVLIALITASFSCLLTSCSSSEKQGLTKGERVIEKAVAKHGGAAYKEASVHFKFRGKHYHTEINKGKYRYSRSYKDSSGNKVRQVLTNDSVYQLVNGERVPLDQKAKQTLKGTLNAINYFFLLPYHLTDEQVTPTYIDSVRIDGEPYHKIKVTFSHSANAGAHEDIYLYWFHKDDYTMDYLAYKYFVSGGGMRFRVAYNVREKGGIIFQDYHNLAPKSKNVDFMKIDSLYMEDALRKVSEINKDSIRVKDL
jgi:hypothetical protein